MPIEKFVLLFNYKINCPNNFFEKLLKNNGSSLNSKPHIFNATGAWHCALRKEISKAMSPMRKVCFDEFKIFEN